MNVCHDCGKTLSLEETYLEPLPIELDPVGEYVWIKCIEHVNRESQGGANQEPGEREP